MKKFVTVLSILLIVSLVFSPLCYAAGTNTDTLVNWGIKITVPDDKTAVLKGDFYYIYGDHEGYLPYVMVRPYKYDSAKTFFTKLTESMKNSYGDLKVVSDMTEKNIGGKTCYETDYGYKVSGYDLIDRRVAVEHDGLVYMFASKEIKALDLTVGTMLEDVIADCVFLTEDGKDEPEPTEEPKEDFEGADYYGYLYCEDNGMPKYWLDLTGTIIDQPVLHCYFISSDPTYYESYFILDYYTADVSRDFIEFKNVYDSHGFDVSDWFEVLTLETSGEDLILDVVRNEKTLAGGTGDNILTGSYEMEPADVGVVYEYYNDDGMLKYWMVGLEEAIELHCMFRSGEPEYHEEVFYLDLLSAEADGDYAVKFNKVTDSVGHDVSNWFKSLTLTQVQTSYMLNVKRDEKTLAGGGDDNILTGVYTFDAHTHFRPVDAGPFNVRQLSQLAQQYYFKNHLFFPPEVEVTRNKDGSFTLHLYEVVSLDGVEYTATSAWYTVDRYGVGTDDISGEHIDLTE